MKKSLILIFFAVVIAAITLVSFWGGKQVCTMMMGGSGFVSGGNVYSRLNLSSDQKEAVKKLDASFMKEADPICMSICRERMALVKMMADPSVNESQIHQKIDEIGSLQTSLEKKVADHVFKIKSELSPDQSQSYVKYLNDELEKSIRQCGYGKILKS